MEVLAGIDSPPEHAEARMAFQVERLASALGERKGSTADSLEALVRVWCLTGPVPAAYAEALEARFEAARSAAPEA
jgi:hypothetical protein